MFRKYQNTLPGGLSWTPNLTELQSCNAFIITFDFRKFNLPFFEIFHVNYNNSSYRKTCKNIIVKLINLYSLNLSKCMPNFNVI